MHTRFYKGYMTFTESIPGTGAKHTRWIYFCDINNNE